MLAGEMSQKGCDIYERAKDEIIDLKVPITERPESKDEGGKTSDG